MTLAVARFLSDEVRYSEGALGSEEQGVLPTMPDGRAA